MCYACDCVSLGDPLRSVVVVWEAKYLPMRMSPRGMGDGERGLVGKRVDLGFRVPFASPQIASPYSPSFPSAPN